MSHTFEPPGPTLSAAALNALRLRASGDLFTPEHPDWDRVRAPWVLNVDQRPLAVLAVADADDVVAAVQWAGAEGVQLCVQPSGHGAGADVSGSLLLRTRALDRIDIDAEGRTARIGAGVNAGELAAALAGTGLTFLAGSNPDPSVVGLTLTGGLSWFGRAYGLGCDSIVAADVVDGTGTLRHVDAADPDLLWALRGGGGDLAVVVSLELRLHPAPVIHGGQLWWPIDRLRPVLDAFRAVCERAPDTFTGWWHALALPPLPEIPEPLRGGHFVTVAVAHLGEADELDDLLAPLRAIPGAIRDSVAPLGPEQIPHLAEEPVDPTPVLSVSTLLSALDAATADALEATVGPGSDCPVAIVQIRQLGGRLAEPPVDQGSHGPIAEPYALTAFALLPAPQLEPVFAGWLRRIADCATTSAAGRTPMNFLAHDEANTWWDDATRARLQAIKATTDPDGVLRSNRPVSV